MSDPSYTVRLAAAFYPTGLIPFTSTLSYLGGGAGNKFTSYKDDNALRTSLEVRFAFKPDEN